MTRRVRLGDVASISQGMSSSGRAAGAREGDWAVRVASVGDIQDDRLRLDDLDERRIEQNVKTEKHLLRPDDVLVTARSSAFKAALVPPTVERTVADATLSVVRAHQLDLGPYLWWYLTAPPGRDPARAEMTGATVLSLPVARLAELLLPLPPLVELRRIAELVEASERAYAAAIDAARLRRTLFRDTIIAQLLAQPDRGADDK
jgi:hypothetical protein